MSGEVVLDLYALSGIYQYKRYCKFEKGQKDHNKKCTRRGTRKSDIGRFVYESVFFINDEKKRVFFGYCKATTHDLNKGFKSKGFWGLTIDGFDPCENWIVRSYATGDTSFSETFNILKHASASWQVRKGKDTWRLVGGRTVFYYNPGDHGLLCLLMILMSAKTAAIMRQRWLRRCRSFTPSGQITQFTS
jgi:hypothetical protein